MTTMYLVLEAMWLTETWDGFELSDSYFLSDKTVYKTKEEATKAAKAHTESSVGDMLLIDFNPDFFQNIDAIMVFDEDAFANERTFSEYIDWAKDKIDDWYHHLPLFWKIEEINVLTVCKKPVVQDTVTDVTMLTEAIEQNKVVVQAIKKNY